MAKSLEELIPLLQQGEQKSQEDEIIKNTIEPVLEKLSQDTDKDVRFFAQKALERDQINKSQQQTQTTTTENPSSPEAKL